MKRLLSKFVIIIALTGCAHAAKAQPACYRHPREALHTERGAIFHWAPQQMRFLIVRDDSISDAHWLEITAAAMSWNLALKTEVFFTIDSATPGKRYTVVPIIEMDSIFGDPNLQGLTISSVGSKSGKVGKSGIIFKKKVEGQPLGTIAFHEFGHLLGLGHDLHDPKSIMYPGTLKQDSNPVLRQEDIDFVLSELEGGKCK